MSFRTSNGGGTQTVQGESSPNLDIPDDRAEGISDTIVIDEKATINGVAVMLDISHTYRGDLQVTLLTPWKDSIVLHQRNQGGREDNIQGTIGGSADLNTVPGLTFFGSSTEYEDSYAYPYPHDPYSLFSLSLISGMNHRNADTEMDGVLSAGEWFQYSYDHTVERISQDSLFQHPVFLGDEDLIISRLTPVPLPGTFSMMVMGLFIIIRIRLLRFQKIELAN